MTDREISRKPWNLCCFECISFAILFGLFSCRFVNSSQASQFAKQNFKYKQNGEGKETKNFLGFPVFRPKPQQGKLQRCSDLQWQNLRPRLNPGLAHFHSLDQRNTCNFPVTQVIYWRSSKWNLYFCLILFSGWSIERSVGVVSGPVHS